MEFPNYYKILELDRAATVEQIWLSYHKLVFLEERKQNSDARRLFWLNEAYLSLIDQKIRVQYDKALDRYYFLQLPRTWRRRLAVFFSGFVSAIVVVFLLRLK